MPAVCEQDKYKRASGQGRLRKLFYSNHLSDFLFSNFIFPFYNKLILINSQFFELGEMGVKMRMMVLMMLIMKMLQRIDRK